MLSTSVIAQSVKLPISSGEYIDFKDPNNPIVTSLPIHPNSGFTSPVTDESVLYSNIVFDCNGCASIPGAPVPLNPEGDDGTVTPLYYLGQSPAFCQNIVTDDYGNVMFYIVDNNIYNRFGVSFVNNQPNVFSEYHYWLHQEPTNQINSNSDYAGEYLNRSIVVGSGCETYLINHRKLLGPELIVVPKPGATNVFYLIYSIFDFTPTAVDHHHYIYYRELQYINDNQITLSEPTEVSNKFYCHGNARQSIAITDYRASEGNYILFVNNGIYLEVFEVSATGIPTATKKSYSLEVVLNGATNSNYYLGFNNSELEVAYKASSNTYYMAMASSGFYPYYLIVEFPYSFSAFPASITGTNNWEIIYTPSGGKSAPVGLEFSANAEYLYFTHSMQDTMQYFDLSLLGTSGTAYTNSSLSFLGLASSMSAVDLNRSQIELGKDGKLYFQGSNGTTKYLAWFNNPSTPTVNSWGTSVHNLFLQSDFQEPYGPSDSVGHPNSCKVYTFQDQVDGWEVEDYIANGHGCIFPICIDNGISTSVWQAGANNNPFLIEGDVIHFGSDVTLPSGVVVSLMDLTIKMNLSKRIIVKASTTSTNGARLSLHNSTLSSFDNCIFPGAWIGVELQGTDSIIQGIIANSKQPAITMDDNSVIKNAMIGINAKNGGVIHAINSSFVNNYICAQFTPYQNHTASGYLKKNISKFFRCDFYTDINTHLSLKYNINLEGVDGVNIERCSFEDYRTGLSTQTTGGIAINSYNAGFTVYGNCNDAQNNDCVEPSTFKGYRHAIYCYGDVNMNAIQVKDCKFENNLQSIYLKGEHNASLFKNHIIMGATNYSPLNGVQHGIFVDGCDAYRVEENFIENIHTPFFITSGITMQNASNFGSNEVYKNTIENTKYGTWSVGMNRGYNNLNDPSGNSGLQILCIDFLDVLERDIIVDKAINTIHFIGHGLPQFLGFVGDCPNNGLAAGNKFSQNNLLQDEDHVDNNTDYTIAYLYNTTYDSREEPIYYTPNWVYPSDYCIDPNNCASNLSAKPYKYPLDVQTKTTVENDFATSRTAYLNLLYSYGQLIDDGNTPAIIQEIQNTWPQEAWNLRNDLMTIAPYISRDALLEAALSGILPDAMLLEICLANPDATHGEEFISIVGIDIPNPLPVYMLDMIRANWGARTPRTILEGQIAQKGATRDFYLNLLITNEKLKDEQSLNSIENWHLSRNNLSDYYRLADLYISKEEFTNAQTILMDILVDYTLDDVRQVEYDNFYAYFELMETLFTEDRTIHNLTAMEKANLETMADEHSGMSSIKARNILCYVYDLCEDELNVDLNPIPKAAIIAGDPQKRINEAYNFSQVYPNPVKEYAEIEFNCPLLNGQATLKVYSVNGKVIHQETVYGPKGKVLLDTRNWIMANYVYEIIIKDQRLTSGKITVIK